jgi:hypothetical protein
LGKVERERDNFIIEHVRRGQKASFENDSLVPAPWEIRERATDVPNGVNTYEPLRRRREEVAHKTKSNHPW